MLDLIDKLLTTVGKLFYIYIYFFLSAPVIQVYLDHDSKVQVYANATIQPNSPVNADLLLDQSEANIYVMTRNTVCAQKTNILPLNVPESCRVHKLRQLFCEASKAAFPFKAFGPDVSSFGRLSFSGWTIYRLSGLF